MADIKIVGGSSGSGGRGDCGEDCEIQQPQQPPFSLKTIFIYARRDGSDCDGDGSLCNPYRTCQRAIRDVPSIIPAAVVYRVDITDIGLEQFPEEYTFPCFTAADDVAGAFDFSQEYFSCRTPVNIQATPKLAVLTPGTGPNVVDSGTLTQHATTKMYQLFVSTANWVPGELVGKFAISSSGVASDHGIIWQNDAQNIWVTQAKLPVFPLRIMEPSAQLQADRPATPLGPVPDLHNGAINVFNSQIGLLGLKINATPTIPNPTGIDFRNFGLHISGVTPRVVMQLCQLPHCGITTDGWAYARQSYLPDLLFCNAPLLIINSFVYKSSHVGGLPYGLTFFGARGVDSLIRQTVFLEVNTIQFRDLFDIFDTFSLPNLILNQVQILNSTPMVTLGHNDESNAGIGWTGTFLRMLNCDISRTVPSVSAPGSALFVKGNSAHVTLIHVTGTGYGRYGVEIVDGGNVEVADVNPLLQTTLKGVLGDTSVGSVGLTAWPAAVYPAVGSNVPDYTSPLAQGARLWRKS